MPVNVDSEGVPREGAKTTGLNKWGHVVSESVAVRHSPTEESRGTGMEGHSRLVQVRKWSLLQLGPGDVINQVMMRGASPRRARERRRP